MSRVEQPQFPGSGRDSLPGELVAALKLAENMIERILMDPDLCLWIRNKFVHERKSTTEAADEFTNSEWALDAYSLESKYPKVIRTALQRLQYELLTPEEIIELHRHTIGQKHVKTIETKGHFPWHLEETQTLVRNILREDGARRKIRKWKQIAKRVSEESGQSVRWGQCQNRFFTKDKKGHLSMATAQAKGQIAWDDRMDSILAKVMDEPESYRTVTNFKYVVGRIAEKTRKVVHPESLLYAIKRYNLLSESEEIMLAEENDDSEPSSE